MVLFRDGAKIAADTIRMTMLHVIKL